MIKGVIGGKALPNQIMDQIIDRTDGIPLFIEELTKAVIETGVVAESNTGSTCSTLHRCCVDREIR
jgi:predicted ATPase